MEKINKILSNSEYLRYLKLIEIHETERKFCKHDINHFLDVARIAYIMVLENKLNINKETVYAAALLHDIGRWAEYEGKESHVDAALKITDPILTSAGFGADEMAIIKNAIRYHRKNENGLKDFSNIFSISDKLSRNCFNCPAKNECKWTDKMKNLEINY